MSTFTFFVTRAIIDVEAIGDRILIHTRHAHRAKIRSYNIIRMDITAVQIINNVLQEG